MFHTVQGFDLGADALNLFLIGSSIHDGLKLAGTFCLGPLTADLPEIADKKRAAVPIDPYYVFGQNVDMAASVYSILLIVAVFFPVCKPWNNRGER
ncbi:MAG: hypothetical protein HGA70_08300 [Chlorobiaceae bacterium]|nr:hypothetical protein [Chlorobiaceae bacterium]